MEGRIRRFWGRVTRSGSAREEGQSQKERKGKGPKSLGGCFGVGKTQGNYETFYRPSVRRDLPLHVFMPGLFHAPISLPSG